MIVEDFGDAQDEWVDYGGGGARGAAGVGEESFEGDASFEGRVEGRVEGRHATSANPRLKVEEY